MRERRYLKKMYEEAIARRRRRRDGVSRAESSAYADAIRMLEKYNDVRVLAEALQRKADDARGLGAFSMTLDERQGRAVAFDLAALMARNAREPWWALGVDYCSLWIRMRAAISPT